MTVRYEGITAQWAKILSRGDLTVVEKVTELFVVSSLDAVESGTKAALRQLWRTKRDFKRARKSSRLHFSEKENGQ